jgi:hypothetical protein
MVFWKGNILSQIPFKTVTKIVIESCFFWGGCHYYIHVCWLHIQKFSGNKSPVKLKSI